MMNAEEQEYMDYLIHNRTQQTKQNTRLLDEIDVLQKKLGIATKALETYARGDSNVGNGCLYEMPAPSLAQQALKEIDLVGTSEKEKDMTWEELCEKAKEIGYELYCEDDLCYLENKNIDLSFFEDGQIEYMYGGIISEGRTPEQMYHIMKALQ